MKKFLVMLSLVVIMLFNGCGASKEDVLELSKTISRSKYISNLEEELKYISYVTYVSADIESKSQNVANTFLRGCTNYDLVNDIIEPVYHKNYVLTLDDIKKISKPFLQYYRDAALEQVEYPVRYKDYRVEMNWSIEEYKPNEFEKDEDWYNKKYDYYYITATVGLDEILFKLFVRAYEEGRKLECEILFNKSIVAFISGQFQSEEFSMDSSEYNYLLSHALVYEICREIIENTTFTTIRPFIEAQSTKEDQPVVIK
ncbi:hypothetical protein [Fusobacterium sp. FSA-380-WT-3A]|uniref:hypothetical protein n=1 Tax=Fusobacterium sp. FSA-380-WT-3A TaxID=2725304 RepID=UPI0014778803|nr:hypothetical protein [Fusobacterium sp. FSA-380-WT-3A]NME35583.1 hypothetical protein [Fusobacterium sp. FSA-380-WT-3A]